MASSTSPGAAVEDGKGPAVPGGCRRPVEVMLGELPPSPAAAAPGRFGIRLRRVEDVWRPEVPSGCSLTKEELGAPYELENSALQGVAPGRQL